MTSKNFSIVLAGVLFVYIIFSCVLAAAEARVIKKSNVKDYGCQCADYSCGCCAHLEAPKIGLNDTGCVNITYLYKEYGISFTMTLDNLTIYNETISARNPPPVCFGAPYLKEFADLCIHFYDLNATRTSLHGCVDIEARMHKVVIGRYKIGCFNLGGKSSGRWKQLHRLLVERIRSRQNMINIVEFYKKN